MPDINQLVESPDAARHDPNGHMLELGPWSPETARRFAALDRLDLTEDHWQVIFYLRDRHREQGRAPNARVILAELADAFRDDGGRSYLYALFPKGPVAQGCRLAGVPAPVYTADPSFGSVS